MSRERGITIHLEKQGVDPGVLALAIVSDRSSIENPHSFKSCGHTKLEMGLGEQVYICDQCGLRSDRDLNTAINLVKNDLRRVEQLHISG
jgi:hypothetical protein